MPIWRSTPNPTCEKRKRADDDEGEPLNSSFQVPRLVHITNARVKASSKAHLLTLPTTVRKKIFALAVVERDPIDVSLLDIKASAEPGLLRGSHDIRNEAIGVFYGQNDFNLHVHDFDAAALLPWLNRTAEHRLGEHHARGTLPPQPATVLFASHPLLKNPTPMRPRLLEKQQDYHLNKLATATTPRATGDTGMTVHFRPNWNNFVAWLKLCHDRKIASPPIDESDSEQERQAFEAFTEVNALRDQEWGVVEQMLPGLRKMLGVTERRWLEDGAADIELLEETEEHGGPPADMVMEWSEEE